MRARVLAGILVCACASCGGRDPDPPDPPGPPDPIFDPGDNRVHIVEGVWPGVGDPWAGVSPWFTNTPGLLTESARIGACRLMVSDTMYCEGCEGWCVGGTCVEFPAGRSAGTIDIDGLTVPLTMTWMDGYYGQSPANPPDDLFEPGASITVTASGDEVAAFAATVTGVATIEPDLGGACDNEWHLVRGEDAEITWSDPVEGARVRLRIPAPNNGHGMPPAAVIECEGPDAGRFVVPAALIDGLPDLDTTDPCAGIACEGYDCPPSSLARYSRSTAAAGAETVEVRASAEVLFYVFDD